MLKTIKDILAELTGTEGVLGCALIGLDGIVIGDHFVVDVNLDKLGALLSSAYNALDRVMSELKQGSIAQGWLETERYCFLIQAVPIGLLVVVARHDASLGLIRLCVRQAILHLEQIEI